MLIACRSTSHPATGVAPYKALKGTPVRIKLDYIVPDPQRNEKDDIIDRRDAEYKQKMKQQRKGRKTRENNLLLGDYANVKQPRKNKWSTPLAYRGRNVPDCLPVSSDRQNVFLPVSTNIQLEQYFFNIILF